MTAFCEEIMRCGLRRSGKRGGEGRIYIRSKQVRCERYFGIETGCAGGSPNRKPAGATETPPSEHGSAGLDCGEYIYEYRFNTTSL